MHTISRRNPMLIKTRKSNETMYKILAAVLFGLLLTPQKSEAQCRNGVCKAPIRGVINAIQDRNKEECKCKETGICSCIDCKCSNLAPKATPTLNRTPSTPRTVEGVRTHPRASQGVVVSHHLCRGYKPIRSFISKRRGCR